MQLYADDAILIYSSVDPLTLHRDIESGICLVNDWLYNNLLFLNISKTPVQLSIINLSSSEVNRTGSCRYLRLLIDENLC